MSLQINNFDISPAANGNGIQKSLDRYHPQVSRKERRVYEKDIFFYADYPFPPFQRFIQGFVGGYYNRYYLTKLADGSWLCVYFDDYLALTGTDNFPTDYVRYTTTEERRMLNRMAEDYDVDPVYVLDMYQHGKVSWMIDVLLRLVVCLAAAGIVWGIKNAISKRIFPTRDE